MEKEKRKRTGHKEREADPLSPTVFHEHWWLSAATGGSYEQVEVSDGNRTVGRFPFWVRERLGRRVSTPPPLTHFLGPAVDAGNGSLNTQLLQRYAITKELISKLPKVHKFWQKLHRGHPEALSFEFAGFRTWTEFTIEVAPLAETDAWSRLRNKTRNVIRRAQEQLDVSESKDSEEFIRFYESNLAVRGRKTPEGRHEIIAVCRAALEKHAGKILCARDRHKRLLAAVFLPFDRRAAYYVMSTRRVDAGNGATSLLIWTAICFCIERGLVFNFDGIGSEGAMLFYAGFGGEPKPIYIVSKDSKRMKVADFCAEVIWEPLKANLL